MGRLDHVSAERLRDGLDVVDDPTATLRLVVGINYKNGVSQSDLARWYGVSRTTIHNWLRRLERLDEAPLAAVVSDDPRPGRPPKLTAEQRARLAVALREQPSERGVDAPDWTPAVVRDYVAEAFGVEYSLRHVRTLLADLDSAGDGPDRGGPSASTR